MLSISKFWSELRKVADQVIEPEDYLDPVGSSVKILEKLGYEPDDWHVMVNFVVPHLIWWQSHNRTMWRITQETADYLKKVNLSFIPETPPPTWTGGSILLESRSFNQPFLHDIFSLVCYHTKDSKGKEKYFFAYLKYPDGEASFSIDADLFKLNKKITESGEIFSESLMFDDALRSDYPAEMRREAYDIIRFVFATSYFIDSDKHINIVRESGPPRRNKKGKVIKKGKRVESIWNYATLNLNPAVKNPGESNPLNRDNLNLEPVIVGPHIRKHNDRVLIIDSYDSHRWKKDVEKMGTKKIL